MSLGSIVKRGATAVATGGNSEWGAGGNLWNGGGGSSSVNQVPLMTPQQKAAQDLLMKYASGGQIGNTGVTAGQDLGMPLGDFSLDPMESQGINAYQGLMKSGVPSQYALGDSALKDLMDTSTSGMAAQFAPYQALSDRQQNLAMAASKRNSAYMGNLYSTDAVRNIGDVAAKTAETNQATLAGLQNDALNRKLGAVPLAYQSGAAQEGINEAHIGNLMNAGALQRGLQNQQLQANYQETLRRRNEVMGQLDAAKTVSGENAQFGVPNVSIPTPSPYMQFMQTAAQFVPALAAMRGGGGGTPPPMYNGMPTGTGGTAWGNVPYMNTDASMWGA